jgi:heme-degrading monooxygenase HmoA
MIVVIFESWPMAGKKQSYLDMAAALMPLVEKTDGFISIERFQSVSEEGKLVALSFWRDEDAVTTWRNVMERRRIQDRSRQSVFDDTECALRRLRATIRRVSAAKHPTTAWRL